MGKLMLKNIKLPRFNASVLKKNHETGMGSLLAKLGVGRVIMTLGELLKGIFDSLTANLFDALMPQCEQR
jgi:hypothetical protein